MKDLVSKELLENLSQQLLMLKDKSRMTVKTFEVIKEEI